VVSAPVATGPDSGPAEPLVKNGSFEVTGGIGEIGAPQDWEGLAMGTVPAVVQDCKVAHEGRCSLKIITDKPVLADAIQTVQLKPNQAYVLTGWIKTERLEVMGKADQYGTLVVAPAEATDESQITKGPNHSGNTDWTQVRLEFVAPADGRINVFCSFCGQSVGRGTVWFDDFRIEPLNRPPATATAPAASQPASGPAPTTTRPAATQPVGA
jgi:hypothetical protein